MTNSKDPIKLFEAWFHDAQAAGIIHPEIMTLATCTRSGHPSARMVLYKGTAGEAALLYPQNANVAAAVALAGLGFDATEVELVADPDAPGNIHEIEAEGEAGRFAIQLQGKASRTNPKTSALAALSVARALLNRHATIVI